MGPSYLVLVAGTDPCQFSGAPSLSFNALLLLFLLRLVQLSLDHTFSFPLTLAFKAVACEFVLCPNLRRLVLSRMFRGMLSFLFDLAYSYSQLAFLKCFC